MKEVLWNSRFMYLNLIKFHQTTKTYNSDFTIISLN